MYTFYVKIKYNIKGMEIIVFHISSIFCFVKAKNTTANIFYFNYRKEIKCYYKVEINNVTV